MARPTGRYFASVIAKIRDAQRNEQIVIDGDFKMRLRQQVMMKAAARVQPMRKSWQEILAPYRSYLAVVPALGLVIVAVVGISKLPVLFTSNVVIPVSGPTQESQQNVPQNILNDVSGSTQNAQTVQNDQPTIKTFPGRLVLPPTKSAESATTKAPEVPPVSAPTMLQANTLLSQPQESKQPAQTGSSTLPVQPKIPDQDVQQVSKQVQPPTQVQNQPLQNVVGPSSFVPQTSAPAPVLPSVSGSTPVPSEDMAVSPAVNPVQTQPTFSAEASVSGSAAAVSLNKDLQASVTTTPEKVTSLAAPVTQQTVQANQQTTQITQMVQKSSTPIQQKVLQISKPKTLAPTLNEIAALPAAPLNVNVYYSGNFSNDEQTVLEKNLIPHLVDSKDVSYVVVYQKDPATVVIELNYTNGDIGVYTYQIDATGTLQLTESVLRKG